MADNHESPDAIDIAIRVARAVERVGGAYFVGGSLASSLQGEPRSTNDIDIVMTIPLGHVAKFVAELGPDFEVDVEMLRHCLLHGASCNIFFLPTVMKVDLFAVGPSTYDEVEFSRRRSVIVRPTGEELVVKSPEDTVLRKLLWYREGGFVSDRQWRDVVEVLRVSAQVIDAFFLEDWAQRLGIAELLERARRESAT